jgi:hypothetical protein
MSLSLDTSFDFLEFWKDQLLLWEKSLAEAKRYASSHIAETQKDDVRWVAKCENSVRIMKEQISKIPCSVAKVRQWHKRKGRRVGFVSPL